MKWILNRIRRLTAVVPSQQSASGHEPLAVPQQGAGAKFTASTLIITRDDI